MASDESGAPRPPISGHASDLQTIMAGDHLPALDGLRAVAVFLVVAYHFGFPVDAGLGVTGFFVLSGFLITWLMRKEQLTTGTMSMRKFYLRRVLRIFPAYFVYVGLSLAVMVIRDMPRPSGLVSSALLYVMNYYNAFHGHPPGPFSHLWSLAVEEQFYLLWPMLFVTFARRDSRTLTVFLSVAIVSVLAWRSMVYLQTGNHAYAYNAFDTRFDSLAVGCLLALSVEGRWFRQFVVAIAGRSWFPLLTVALLMASQRAPLRYHFTLGLTIDSVLLAVLIIQLVTLHASRLWLWLQHPTVRYIGVISYPMYLYHPWGIAVGYKASILPPIGQFVIGSLVTIVAAAASYHFVERRFLVLKKRFESHGRREAPGPPSLLVHG